MDKVKKLILFRIPMSICNFRCHYCYLAQRPTHYEGNQPTPSLTPEQFGYAFRKERIGGLAYGNFCADGETLLVKNIDSYIKAFVEQGHYVEIVSNMTVTPMLDKILAWPKDLLAHVEFKCSFHYLELKQKRKLDVFASNIKKVWAAGASANIEITPSDELIPYLDEVKEYSLNNFGALPHITIARDDRSSAIDYLTELPMAEYDKVWSTFDSGFWRYKKTIFGKYQEKFCYAGAWMLYVDFYNGDCQKCYAGPFLNNVYANLDVPLPSEPIGRCPLSHCYNGHMLLTLGLIPGATPVRYGDIRNRERADGGGYWLNSQVYNFFDTKLEESNEEWSPIRRRLFLLRQGTPKSINDVKAMVPASVRNVLRKLKP